MRLLSSIARAPFSRFASSMSRWVSNLFVARAFHSSTSENDVVTYGEDNVTSFMSSSALLLAQSQPDVFLTINYSKKTIPSLSAYYFHLPWCSKLLLMFLLFLTSNCKKIVSVSIHFISYLKLCFIYFLLSCCKELIISKYILSLFSLVYFTLEMYYIVLYICKHSVRLY